MIIGKETNTVYLSERLRSESRSGKACDTLTAILDRHKIIYRFLKGTRDIWCRDYMPIQTLQNEFVQFRYEPSYLERDLELQSDPKEVCKANNIRPKFSNINLDGGNVVNWLDKAIVTDRVFTENPAYTNKAQLISEMEQLLQAEIIVIPHINGDMTGHADGHVRFVNGNMILGNDRTMEYKYWSAGTNKAIKQHGIEYIDIPFFTYPDKKYKDNAIGCYVNYLEVGHLIVLPIFEIRGNRDEEVYNLFTNIFPDKIIETINYNEIGLHGGLLNCTTWNIHTI